VDDATTTSPRLPCGRTIRPMAIISAEGSAISLLPSVVPEIHDRPPAVELAGGGRERADGGRRAALAPDDAPQIARRHRQLDHGLTAALVLGHLHVLGPRRQRPRDDVD